MGLQEEVVVVELHLESYIEALAEGLGFKRARKGQREAEWSPLSIIEL